MSPLRQGSFRLFRFAGIQVGLHWSWFLVAAYEVNSRSEQYTSFFWNGLEYLTLFVIVLLHEFGHALACRQVGGQAERIVLWPLGGIAYVSPPLRPGAMLWSIAAGPLVNVMLVPVLFMLGLGYRMAGWAEAWPNLGSFLHAIWAVNLGLLVFNLLPLYPLDGGQILQALLWFIVGRARSLMIVTIIGFIGVGALLVAAAFAQSPPLIAVTVFMLLICWGGWAGARTLARADRAPRHVGFKCPGCQAAPPQGDFWLCGSCRKAFDTFRTVAVCPHCGAQFAATRCLDCGGNFPIQEWATLPSEPPLLTSLPPPWPAGPLARPLTPPPLPPA
jgi:Zn-dependent protease